MSVMLSAIKHEIVLPLNYKKVTTASNREQQTKNK